MAQHRGGDLKREVEADQGQRRHDGAGEEVADRNLIGRELALGKLCRLWALLSLSGGTSMVAGSMIWLSVAVARDGRELRVSAVAQHGGQRDQPHDNHALGGAAVLVLAAVWFELAIQTKK